MSDNGKRKLGIRLVAPPLREDAGAGPDAPDQETLKACLIDKAREVVYQTPEVRPEKVARLKEAIEQGAYRIDSRQLADILIKEWFPKR